MTDVFISYAREDRDRASKLATALTGMGWSVWWDRKIITGQAFDEAIEHELETAKSVVVLWSSHSVASEWVKNEAAVASERGVLVPAMIENVKLPLEFRRKQTADLTGWNGDSSHSGFQALCEGVASVLGTLLQEPKVLQSQKWRWNPHWTLTAILFVAFAVALGIYSLESWKASTRVPNTERDRLIVASSSKESRIDTANGLADLVIGSYFGNVIADSKGSSRSDVVVTISKLARSTVRVSSDYSRLGTIDIALTRIGNQILNANGDTPFIVDLDHKPPSLVFDPHSEVSYRGNKR